MVVWFESVFVNLFNHMCVCMFVFVCLCVFLHFLGVFGVL